MIFNQEKEHFKFSKPRSRKEDLHTREMTNIEKYSNKRKCKDCVSNPNPQTGSCKGVHSIGLYPFLGKVKVNFDIIFFSFC